MSLHWRPVGPEPEHTYWRRRALVALAALVPLVLVLQLLGGDDGPERLAQGPAPAPSAEALPAPTGAPSAVPSADATPVSSPTAAACAAAALELTAGAADNVYAVGSQPRLELRVTNTGALPCTADLGRAAVELLVFSGADRIWSSDDCAPDGGSDVTTLPPGRPAVLRATWPGTRSLPGCAGPRAKAQAGTYRVAARLGELRTEGDAFHLR